MSADTPIDRAIEQDQHDLQNRRAKGEFVRGQSQFRAKIGEDPDFPPDAGRYHLYVALNCPWCHRVTLARNVLGLSDSVSCDVAFPNRTEEGDPAGEGLWEFNPARLATLTQTTLPGCTTDTASGHTYRIAKQLYEAEGSDEKSLPILYDKKTKRIVSNESAEIVRMFALHAQALGAKADAPDLYPKDAALRADIDALNQDIYVNINNGAYRAGFSSDQSVYEAAFKAYFAELQELDDRLSDGRLFLTGDTFTEADLRLFPTLYRHDPVYYVRMKLNGARLLDYPHLWRWLCRVYALPGIADAGSLIHCRQGYFGRSWNRVVPIGPILPMPYPEAYLHPELV